MFDEVVSERLVSLLLVSAQVIIAYIAVLWLALTYWTFRDIRKRTTDPVVQGLSVALVFGFFLAGYWVYLLLRPGQTIAEREEERLRAALISDYAVTALCPYCREQVRDDFVLCPSCHFALREACKTCTRALQPMWSVCPFCASPRPGTKESRPVEIGETPYAAAVGK